MKKLALLVAVLLAYLPLHSQDSTRTKWSYSLGMGTALTPSYLGDNSYQLMIFPNFRASYSTKFSFSLFEGVQYNFLNGSDWRIGPMVKYNFGRDEDGSNPLSIAGSETQDLVGLGGVDFTIEPGVFVEYKHEVVTSKFELRQGLGGHKGLIVEVKSQYRSMIKLFGNKMFYSFGPEIKVSNANYNNAFFGISAAESASTSMDQYEAEFGVLSYGANGSLVLPLSKQFSTIFFGGVSRLGDAGAKSNLVRKKGSANQFTLGLMLNYKF